MKKNTMTILVLAAMMAGATVHAEDTQNVGVLAAHAQEAAIAATEMFKLSTDEQAFAARLSDQNRKSFLTDCLLIKESL